MSTTAPFVISRTFKAPRKLVWEVYSEQKHQAPLLGDKGSTHVYSKLDFRVGGTHHYAMDAGGGQLWGMQKYLEIVPLEKIVLIQSFSDKDGGITRHPAAATWPAEMLATTVLEDAGPGECKVTVTWAPYNSDEAGNATFDAAREGMSGGFGALFTKMDAYFAEIQ